MATRRNSTKKISSTSVADEQTLLPSEMKFKDVPIKSPPTTSVFDYKNAVILLLFFGTVIIIINIYELRNIKNENFKKFQEDHQQIAPITNKANFKCNKPKVWIHGGKGKSTVHLHNVIEVFQNLGFENYTESDNSYNVLWSHEYPFGVKEIVSPETIESHHMINHIPGFGYITRKVTLATSNNKFINKAFKIPGDKDKLLDYVQKNPKTMWIQKNNEHRGIKLTDVKNLDFSSKESFIQEFVSNPLLIDGRKFDIGIYAIMTSINPLRAYIYEGEALLRFCQDSYLPFNKDNINSYVIGDHYTPTWNIPSLRTAYGSGLTMKKALNSYLITNGKDPEKIWSQIREAIFEVYTSRAELILQVANSYRSTSNFFEMVRFDFMVDEDLIVHLMEANMSPNLSSLYITQNKPIYEQVIFNLLSLTGVVNSHLEENELKMKVNDRDLVVFPNDCASEVCQKACNEKCRLCVHCLTRIEKSILKKAFLEHHSRWKSRRILPQPITQSNAKTELSSLETDDLSVNQLQNAWFNAKCLEDVSWCS